MRQQRLKRPILDSIFIIIHSWERYLLNAYTVYNISWKQIQFAFNFFNQLANLINKLANIPVIKLTGILMTPHACSINFSIRILWKSVFFIQSKYAANNFFSIFRGNDHCFRETVYFSSYCGSCYFQHIKAPICAFTYTQL